MSALEFDTICQAMELPSLACSPQKSLMFSKTTQEWEFPALCPLCSLILGKPFPCVLMLLQGNSVLVGDTGKHRPRLGFLKIGCGLSICW